MRIVLFCENKYAVDILLPIYQEAVKSETNHILWYVHLPKIPVSHWTERSFTPIRCRRFMIFSGSYICAGQYCSLLFAGCEDTGFSWLCGRKERSLGHSSLF